MTYHYEHWPGTNYFFCSGRIMLGSSPGMLIATFILELATFGIFVGFVTPLFPWYFTLIACLFLALSFLFLLLTALTDPGIIPRCLLPSDASLTPQPPEQLDTDGGMLKFCDTCLMFRPPRAKHCRFCDNCVLQFDHHCPWVGSCVGKRNYRWFLSYLLTVLVLVCYIFALVLETLVRRGLDEESESSDSTWLDRLGHSISSRPASFALGIFLFGIGFSVIMLLCYHMNLLRKGETTNEALRGVWRRRINPYTKGFFSNLKTVFTDIPPSQIDFLSEVVQSDSVPGLARTREDMRRRRQFDAHSPEAFGGLGRSFGDTRTNAINHSANETKSMDEETVLNGGGGGAGGGTHGAHTDFSYQQSSGRSEDLHETNNLLEPLSPNKQYGTRTTDDMLDEKRSVQ